MGGGVSVVVGEQTLGIVMFVKDRILPGGDFVLVFVTTAGAVHLVVYLNLNLYVN